MTKTIKITWFIVLLLGLINLSLSTPYFAAAADFQAGKAVLHSKDYATELRKWEALAKQGDAKAQYSLGQLYRSGHGVGRDYAQAAK